ncbi:hypothetical protein [Marinitenerispora sediminis]|uniref:Uncharacterized protein n=1 Tax=Marinitenerispora sediminis TaxID=1931232 RepID=A0A368SYY5_9ACTN|nr:hypothetical protein [Marinitenerispora sediminis]RCV49131.1 hypothetical protein DEF28_21780 [Marinitenerispora sediminis]RCV50154.1 hypothetical protein DEF24_24545 [Marinitenerispora sediminis]RCV57234.1 hypothetical protein DEF23_11115 [Marinitenerispora sediminis]
MALTNRRRWGLPLRAVRRSAAPLLRRALALGGIAAAGWLMGGAGSAIADQLPVEATVVGFDRGVASDLAELRSAAGVGEPRAVGGSPERSVGEPSRGALVIPPADTAARELLGGTAHGAGELVSGTVHAGREVGAYADRSLVSDGANLAGRVSDGLARPAGGIADGLHGVIEEAPRPGPLTALVPEDLAAIPGTLTPTGATGPGGGVAGAADPEEQSEPNGREPAEAASSATEEAAAGRVDGGLVAAGLAQVDHARSAGAPDQDASGAEPADPSWQRGSDSAGAVSGSSSVHAPAAAGFLAHRADMLRPTSQRLAVPGDTRFVVRDAADDPSFSPD